MGQCFFSPGGLFEDIFNRIFMGGLLIKGTAIRLIENILVNDIQIGIQRSGGTIFLLLLGILFNFRYHHIRLFRVTGIDSSKNIRGLLRLNFWNGRGRVGGEYVATPGTSDF